MRYLLKYISSFKGLYGMGNRKVAHVLYQGDYRWRRISLIRAMCAIQRNRKQKRLGVKRTKNATVYTMNRFYPSDQIMIHRSNQ